MNIRTYTKVFLLFSLLSTPAFAKKHRASGAVPHIPKSEGLNFVENKGQWVEQAKFKAEIPGGVMFVTNQGFVYNYVQQSDLDRIHELTHEPGHNLSNEIVHQHAYKVNFAGANTNVKYTQTEKRSNYNNYFIGNDQSKWAGNVGLFGKVTQQNVYNGVDVSIYSQKGSLKYDFVVAPGADANQIALTFEGVQPVLTAEGNLKIKTSVNEVIEKAPYTYQMINGKETAVKSKYKLTNGKLSFEFPEGYNHQAELIIDPVLVFATYSGGTSQANYSDATTYDQDGNLYAGAYAFGIGWPVTTGAFQTTFGNGGTDAAINKYNELGSALIYSTYFGGNGTDLPHAMIVNDQNELIVVGTTTSSNLIPTTLTSYDNQINGGGDIFVAHFNATATSLIGATYIGGSGTEPTGIGFNGSFWSNQNQNTTSPVEVNFDETGNIWVVSSTPSNDFPVTANALQPTYGGGASDGVLFKFNPTCTSLLYSSYLGGTGNDAISGIKFNSANNLVICGATQSTNFPTTAGVLHATAPGGTTDGFVSIVNATTGAMMVSTFVGTDNEDHAVNLALDEADNIFVLGRTLGNYPVSAGVYNMANSDVFIDKLTPTLTSSIQSTRVGNPQGGTNYFPTAFLHDVCGNTYVAGLNAVAGLPTTADAFQTNYTKFWFVVLEPNFSDILFGSYFGAPGDGIYSDHTHVGVNRLDPEGVVYHSVCANAPTGTFPTTPGSYAPAKQNSGQDIISYKFDFEATGVTSAFALDPSVNANDTGCAPYNVKFHNNSTSSEDYIWDFGDGTPTSTATDPTHIFTNPGVYTVTLYAHADSSCITDDTAYMTITVLKTELPDIVVQDTTLCSYQQSIVIGVQINNPSINNTILWQPATGILSNPTLAQITVDPSLNNLYYVTVKDTIPGICGFSVTDTVHIDLSPRQLDILNGDTVVCEGTVLPLTVVGTPGYTYAWSPSTGVNDTTLLSPTITINQPNIYTIKASYPNCPDTLVSINIGMHYIPTLELGPNKAVCQWTEVAFESTITPYRPDYIYQWTPAEGLSYTTGPNTDLIADTSGTWYLDVKTPIGCASRDSIKLIVYPGNFGAAATDTGYCPPNEVALWATGGVSYSWTPAYGLSDTSIANPVASPLTTTDYTVYIKDIHNCLDTQKLTVSVYPLAMLTLPDSINIYPGEQYQVEPGTNCLYFQWFPSSGVSNANIADPKLSPEVRTRYFITATTEHGCTVSDSMDVLVKETILDMPNAFAPNGTNNLFKPTKRGIAQLKSFAIFNRWGNKVYNSSNIDEGWDGTFNGSNQPMGVYMYIIEAVTDNGKVFTQQGNVTLIR